MLARYEADPEIRVVVLAGAGDKAFVSGADISQFEKQRSGPEAVQRYEEIAEGAQRKLQDFDKPMVAMIRGYCLGAGRQHRQRAATCASPPTTRASASRRRRWASATAPRR